ncbi:hypothetical protein L1987_16443 [Smallanthus sonchifolius]|uniref:Uncharacterized protein n=1 Tax=Smallanthus sonchifolius TaxID=185202 RepID=A0ACB9J968_9ASTR|nr:hypothetical protein L1987_16443 [Smallanthus sonchifolius]
MPTTLFVHRFLSHFKEKISQRLIEAAHTDDLKLAFECLADPFIDANFVGTVCLNSRKTEMVLHDEAHSEVRVEFEEFKTDVTALFTLVRKLLIFGANVNKKLFRGYATTAAARGSHIEILELLIGGRASQLACEEALLEASHLGLAKVAKALMVPKLIRPNVAVHALVNASCRGFADVVETLLKVYLMKAKSTSKKLTKQVSGHIEGDGVGHLSLSV